MRSHRPIRGCSGNSEAVDRVRLWEGCSRKSLEDVGEMNINEITTTNLYY